MTTSPYIQISMTNKLTLPLLGICLLLVLAFFGYQAYQLFRGWSEMPDHLMFAEGGALVAAGAGIGILGYLGRKEYLRKREKPARKR